MLTSSEMTAKVLNVAFLGEDGKINEHSLNHQLIHWIETDGRLYGLMKNHNAKATTVTFATITQVANCILSVCAYPQHYATGAQIKEWLERFGRGYESIQETLNYVQGIKKEESK